MGASQLGLGVLAITSAYDRGPAVQRLAVKQVVAGSAAVAVGSVFMFLPSSLEKLTKDPEYLALQQRPTDPGALRRFETRWVERAASARTLRLLAGSLTLSAGVGVSAWGGISLDLEDRGAREGDTVWALATVNAGLLLVASGVFDLVIRSPIERALLDYRSDGPTRTFSVSVSPTPGGGSVAVRF